MSTFFILLVTATLARNTNGHAYVADPISRNAVGSVGNGLCSWNGAIPCVGDPQSWNQEETTTGCGIVQSGSTPYVFGNGGLGYANTKYLTQYNQNELIEVKVKATAMHGGRYEFRIQDIGSAMDPDGSLWKDLPLLTVESFTPACDVPNCRDEPCVAAKTCANIPLGNYGTVTGTDVKMMVQLPSNLVCDHCVMQWRYVTGNSCPGGISCEGGEKFWNCIDLKITPSNPVQSPTATPSRVENTNRPTVIPTSHPSFQPVPVPTIAPSKIDDTIRPTVIPTNRPSLQPVTASPTRVTTGECQPKWAKCGGQSWSGPTCCEAESHCNYESKWYSQCIPGAAPSNPVPSPTVAPSRTEDTIRPTVIPTIKPSFQPTRVTNGECQSLWEKCGGESWSGPTCCEGESYCNYQSKWYSQCIKKV